MILLLCLVIVLFSILSFKKPVVALGLILALLPTYLIRLKLLNIPTTLLELMVGIFLLTVLVSQYNPESWKKIKKLGVFNLVIGLFFLGALFSTLLSPEPLRALGQLKAFFIEPILFFYASIIILNKKNVLLPLQMLFWSTAIISLFGLVQYWTHLFLPLRFWGYGEEVKRITSIFEYPNALALFLAPLLVFFSVLQAKGFEFAKRYWSFVGLVLMFAALVLTYSRGALIAVVVGLMLLAQSKTKVTIKKSVLAMAIILLIVSPLVYNRFKHTFNDASSTERLGLYKVAINKILDEPLVGNGLYGFRGTLEHSTYSGEVLNYPHNIILNFWLETGFLGVFGFVLLIFLCLKRAKQKNSALKYAASLYLLTMFIHGMVDAPYFKNDLSLLFWFILALFFIED
jgi:putative inorganic carbon (hco3(-)) transporter